VLATTLASCNKPQAPTSPTPVATVVEPTVYLEVNDNSCCNKSGINSEIPWAAYSYCRTLYITGGANSIKFTETLTVFAEDGELMFTTNFGGNVQTLAAGIVRLGCGGGARHNDASRFGRSYTYRIDYTTDTERTGFAEGSARYTISDLPPKGVVISQFRSRGPRGTGDQFVEITNQSSVPINLKPWWIQLSSSATSIRTVSSLDQNFSSQTILQPGCSTLMTASGGGYSAGVRGDLLFTPDLTDAIGIGLRREAGYVVDQVAMSANTVFKQGTPLEPFGTANTDRSYLRVSNTGDNSRDFRMISPSRPRNISMCSQTASSPFQLLPAIYAPPVPESN
jgi:hypothetical protein